LKRNLIESNNMNKPKVIVIVGPTASGKTNLSVELAKRINGEIISADSMQIYKNMDIGTAKPTAYEMENIKHYMIDFISPEEDFNVAKFKHLAEQYIIEILQKGKVPIIVGGTGLYINSLVFNIEYGELQADYNYREELEKTASEKGLSFLYNQLKDIDPNACKKISENDKKRIIRALEIYKITGKTKTKLEELSKMNPSKYDYKIYGIQMDRQLLYNRINKRVDLMIEQGLIEEVLNLVKKYRHFSTAMQGLGYKEVVEFLEHKVTKLEMIETIKIETRRYAKRQLTWFRANKDITWLDGQAETEENVKLIMEGQSE